MRWSSAATVAGCRKLPIPRGAWPAARPAVEQAQALRLPFRDSRLGCIFCWRDTLQQSIHLAAGKGEMVSGGFFWAGGLLHLLSISCGLLIHSGSPWAAKEAPGSSAVVTRLD